MERAWASPRDGSGRVMPGRSMWAGGQIRSFMEGAVQSSAYCCARTSQVATKETMSECLSNT